MMKTRGKILRQPGQGPGIVMIEGQQFRFQLEGVWQSDIAPQPGQAVEVYLDRELQVIGISVVTEAQEPNQSGPKALQAELQGSATSTGILRKLYAKLLGRNRQHATKQPKTVGTNVDSLPRRSTMKNATRNSVLFLAATIISVAPAMLAQMAQPQASPPQQNVQQMRPASAPASLCANRPLCYEANDFVVTVSEFRTSTDGYGNKILDAMMHFQNKTNQPISLGYVDGSGSALDDMGNRFALNTGGGGVRGMGVVAGNNMDPKFTLPPGGAGDARFELWWPPRGKLAGVNYEMELSIREMTRIEGNQWTLGDETLIHYQGLANGMGVAPVSGSMVSGGGMGSMGGTVNSFASQGNVISTSGQPMSAYSTQPCPPGSSTTGALTNAANAAGGQNQNANSAINNASQAISNLGSLFHKKKAANTATPTATANAAGPCTPATNVSGPSAAPVGNPAMPTSTATAPAVSPTPNAKAAVTGRPIAAPATTPAVEKAPVTASAETGTTKTTAQKPSAAVVKTSLKQPAPAAKTATTPPKKPATATATTNNSGSAQ